MQHFVKKYLDFLNIPASERGGICYGLAFKAIEAHLLGEEQFDRYQQRMTTLDNEAFYEQFQVFTDAMEKLKNKKGDSFNNYIENRQLSESECERLNLFVDYTRQRLNKPENLTCGDLYQVFLEIRAFLEAVSIAQAPTVEHTGQENVRQFDVSLIAPVVQSELARKRGGVSATNAFMPLEGKEQLEKYLTEVEQACVEGSLTVLLSMYAMNVGGHGIMLAYNAAKSGWFVADNGDNLFFAKNQIEELVSAIMDCVSDVSSVYNTELELAVRPFALRNTKSKAEVRSICEQLSIYRDLRDKKVVQEAVQEKEGRSLYVDAILGDSKKEEASAFLAPLLCQAVQWRRLGLVKELLQGGVDPNILVEQNSVLYLAVRSNQRKVVELLLVHGVDVTGSAAKKALDYADRYGYKKIAKLLRSKVAEVTTRREETSVDVNRVQALGVQLQQDSTVLHWAARTGRKEAFEIAKKNSRDLYIKNEQGYTPLHLAVLNNHVNIVNGFMKEGFLAKLFGWNKKLCDVQSKQGDSALHIAIKNGNAEIFDRLFRAGANKNIQNEEGDTLLHTAIKYNQTNFVNRLIWSGANLHLKNKLGQTAFELAVNEGHLDIFYSVLEAIPTPKQEQLEKLLFTAVEKGHTEIFRSLVTRLVAKSLKQTLFIEALLFTAVEKGHTEIFRSLFTRFVAKSPKQTPFIEGLLFTAVKKDHAGIARQLLEKMPSLINGKKSDSETPLLLAAKNDHLSLIKMLLDKGADPDSKVKEGETPLYYMVKYNRLEMVEKLHEKGVTLDNKTFNAILTDVDFKSSKSARYILKNLHSMKVDEGVRSSKYYKESLMEESEVSEVLICRALEPQPQYNRCETKARVRHKSSRRDSDHRFAFFRSMVEEDLNGPAHRTSLSCR